MDQLKELFENNRAWAEQIEANEVLRPLAILDGLRAGFSRVPLYSLVFLCRATGGEVSPHPLECLDAGWFAEDELPSPIASYDRWGRTAFDAIAGLHEYVQFDHPRDPVWRSERP